MLNDEDSKLIGDFIAENWAAFTEFCQARDVSEVDAEIMLEILTKD